MEESIFSNKDKIPDYDDLTSSLGNSYALWQAIVEYVHSKYKDAFGEWNCSKNGWSFRLKDKRRAIIYLLQRDKYFKVAFVF